MDPLAFVTWQFVLFSLAIFATTYIIRLFIEYFFPTLKTAKVWTDLILPVMPILLGGGLSILFSAYPFTTGLVTIGDHFLFGIVSGLISGLIYRVTKGMLLNQISAVVTSLTPSNSSIVPTQPPLPPGIMGAPMAEKIIDDQTKTP